jgi:hypothetical protein
VLHSVVERERAELLVVSSTNRGKIGRVVASDVALATSKVRFARSPSRPAGSPVWTRRRRGHSVLASMVDPSRSRPRRRG